jgi:hypothetical protein
MFCTKCDIEARGQGTKESIGSHLGTMEIPTHHAVRVMATYEMLPYAVYSAGKLLAYFLSSISSIALSTSKVKPLPKFPAIISGILRRVISNGISPIIQGLHQKAVILISTEERVMRVPSPIKSLESGEISLDLDLVRCA